MSQTIYYILGTPNSGRKTLVQDLIQTGLPEGTHPLVLMADTELDSQTFTEAQVQAWKMDEGKIVTPDLEDNWDTLFFINEGSTNPVDQIEAFAAWLKEHDLTLTRAITLLDCHLAHKQPELAPWYQACVHFSDVVLLNFKNESQPKGFKEFLKLLKHECSPCLFETLKKGCVHNPAQILYPEARRLSHLFDDLDPLDSLDLDEDDLPTESFVLENAPDPYLERLPTGQRCKSIPDIQDYLP
tara:strand:- start:4087 stop:4812 length:726 start_codon:yes stop_codon:yes gene_type:complete